MKKFRQFLKRLTIFDYLTILVVITSLIFLDFFIFKKEKWIKVEVRVTRPEWWWKSKNPPYWLVDQIKKGSAQYDTLGRKVAEVLEVRNYELGGNRKVVYLTLDVKVEVDKRKKKLKFEHRPLEIGKPVELEFGTIGFQGLVTFIEGIPDLRNWEDKIVEARVLAVSNIFPETLGVLPWKAEAIKVGDQMKDSQGRVIAKILAKKVLPAEKIVTTSDGRVLMRQDPVKKDVILKVKLKTFKQENINYYLDDIKVKVGSAIFLALPEIDILPEITKILE